MVQQQVKPMYQHFISQSRRNKLVFISVEFELISKDRFLSLKKPRGIFITLHHPSN